MGDVVNLNKFRKTRGKRDAAARAAENRIRFGQPKDQLSKARKEAEKAESDLDSKRLD
jgi:Domain of unknown function (DUF4169)